MLWNEEAVSSSSPSSPPRRASFFPSRHTLIGGLSVLSVATAGCEGSSPPPAHAHVDVVAGTASAVHERDLLRAVNGTYGPHCSDRAGSWSLPVGDVETPLSYPPLSVLPNDGACVLTLTDIVTAAPDDAMLLNPRFDPPIPLSDSWAMVHSRISMPGSVMRGNARLDVDAATANVALSIIVSADPSLDEASVAAAAGESRGGVEVNVVAAPDYVLRMADAAGDNPLAIGADAAKIVTSVTGAVTLLAGAHTGDGYVIDLGTLPASPVERTPDMLRRLYERGTPYPIDGMNVTIAPERLALVGADLSSGIRRTVIIARVEHGVASFQTLDMSFAPPE